MNTVVSSGCCYNVVYFTLKTIIWTFFKLILVFCQDLVFLIAIQLFGYLIIRLGSGPNLPG